MDAYLHAYVACGRVIFLCDIDSLILVSLCHHVTGSSLV